MIDKNDLENIKSTLAVSESERDSIIRLSREIIKLSKKTIYAVHRNDMAGAESALHEMDEKLNTLKSTSTNPKLTTSGAFKVAIQEYVEARCFYELIKNNKIPTNQELGLDPEFYLLGLIDLTGELVRKAINSAIGDDFQTAVNMKNIVNELYDELMLFDFSGGELRKKFDSIKYDLKKLDDLVLSLKLNRKI